MAKNMVYKKHDSECISIKKALKYVNCIEHGMTSKLRCLVSEHRPDLRTRFYGTLNWS